MKAKVQSIISNGTASTVVEVECHLSNSLPNIVIVGSASKTVDEARERIRGSFATSRIMLPRKRITVNLAPADVPKSDSGFDLAIAVSILLAGGEITCNMPPGQAFIGELGLDGQTRPVRGIIGKILFGRTKGIKRYFIAEANLAQASLIPGIEIIPVASLSQLYGYLCLGLPFEAFDTDDGNKFPYISDNSSDSEFSLSEIVGQSDAKRALQIAAAGGHNIMFHGPPGTGKSMLIKALPSIMPPLNREEILEVTHLHSLASLNYGKIVSDRPFRSPHHSSSYISLVGGGIKLKPGEISLAHHGILFLDEFPEFSRPSLEALRQPLEDKVVNLARASSSVQFPANFIFAATANPCACGYYTSATRCRCTPAQLTRYSARMSGPIIDRIDLFCKVDEVVHDKLLFATPDKSADEEIRNQVIAARKIQHDRNNGLNSDLSSESVRNSAQLSHQALTFLNQTASQNNMSARGYIRAVKVARTIADLENSSGIEVAHISEALSFRQANFLGDSS